MKIKKKKQVIDPIFSKQEQPVQAAAPATNQRPTAQNPHPAQQPPVQQRVTPSVSVKEPAVSVEPAKTTPNAGGFGVSISAFGKKKEEETPKADITIEVLNDRFTPLQLINEWKAYAESLTEELHLRNTMLNCLPNLIANTVFEVIVNNPVQEQRLLEYQMDILSRLRAQLRNTHLRMEIRISENNEKKLAFTPAEKFNLMMEENESLRRLKDEFGLELS